MHGWGAEFPITTTILVIGPEGTGKSATINRLLGKDVCPTDAFGLCTKKVTLGA